MSPSTTIVSSVTALERMLDRLATINTRPPPTERPALYLDLEGVQLGRHGSIAVLSLHFLPDAVTYLVDVHELGKAAFDTKNRDDYSLRTILEFPIPKVFFDVRNDSDALFNLYGIALGGVQDLQLMELAANAGGYRPAERVSGLARCVERDLSVSSTEKLDWLQCKKHGQMLFDPKKDGAYKIFNKRPLDPKIVDYCSRDVEILPSLWTTYAAQVCKPDGSGFWRDMIREASKKRVELAREPWYDGQAPGKVSGPWDNELVESAREDWNEDVLLMGVRFQATLEESSFGVFRWVKDGLEQEY
ncbi:Ribonuclease H-like protein [Akanthomyces lecanii RCEF 1005]|uniref:Ribonuclease H-like protein n=1 Tax=Akanthomyces lecanii RCEF 1005 TaxID=1081108 RepID=A0A162MKB8_CORDF|nr:Ribonuclease H-like protein [Akanthomyces lecanii RCEF 1005]